MAIIGKLLKKTNQINYKRVVKRGKNHATQRETLLKLLDYAKNTKFGLTHSFLKAIKQKNPVLSFQQNTPITEYEEFYTLWLAKTIEGKKDHTWPGRIKYFALSSGTTGSPSKRIPVSEKMIRSFQKTSVRQLSTLHDLNLSEQFYSTSALAVGGSTKLTKKRKHTEGDLSGILKKHTSLIVSPITKPGSKIASMKDWNQKLEAMIEKAPQWNIGILAGIPSWCILLMERIVDRYALSSIHDLWPNLEVYVHGGVFMRPYLPRLEKVLGKPIHLLDTYLASEGYFAYQMTPHSQGMKLILNTGVFYEFIPFTSEYFDEDGQVRDKHKAFTLSEIQEKVDYALVISTNAGLWRYLIGDLVRFTDAKTQELVITGRIRQYLSLAGEHLSLENINTAIINCATAENIEISEFCIFADNEHQKHIWFIGCDGVVDEESFIQTLDKQLVELNDDYASARKYTLHMPELKILPLQVFYSFMKKSGKMGSQHKFPRVLNAEQAKRWLTFLSVTE
jgi:phenylacetate-coenzyme A ligase PaaK-like adenylate-forming protein